LTVGAAFAAPAPPAFEVASIKLAAPSPIGRVSVRMSNTPGRVSYSNVTLKDVLANAYKLKRTQINGPSWLETERYDISAKVPDGAPKEQIPAMLQTLLAERFKLAAHRETKEESVYALVVGKSSSVLKKSEEVTEGEPVPPGPDGARNARSRGASVSMNNGKIEINRATVATFADTLANLLGRPVLDMTQIEGKYDFTLEVSMDDLAGIRRRGGGAPSTAVAGTDSQGGGAPAPERDPAASIFTAVRQFGLKLESRKAPVERLIVDRAEKVPSEN